MPEIVEPTGFPTPPTGAVATETEALTPPVHPSFPQAPSSARPPEAEQPAKPPEQPRPPTEQPKAPEKTASDKAPAGRPTPKPSAVTLTISEAARACDVNRRTIRHHRQAGDFPGSFKDQDGMWRIPVEDLEWVGLHPDLGRVSEEPQAASKVDLLRTEVAVLRERLRAAELISTEREKRIDDLRLILRLLPASSVPAASLSGAVGRLGSGETPRPQGLTAGTPAPDPGPAIDREDPVIWLPDTPERRPTPPAGPVRDPEEDRGSIWTPGGSVMAKEARVEPPAQEERKTDKPRYYGPPLDVRTKRHRWFKWRRSKG